jgi:hypothetical protein
MCDRPSVAKVGGVEDAGQSVPWGGLRWNRRPTDMRLPRGSTAKCHVVRGYRFHRPEGKRQRMPGDSPQGFARRRRARRKLPRRRGLCGCSNDTPHLNV